MDIIYQEIVDTKRLLKEAFDRNTIVDAINNRRVLYIKYKGDDTVNVGYRTIEPCVLGLTTAGNLAVRAWQQNGASDSFKGVKRPMRPNHDNIPEWRLFKLDNILDVINTGKQSTLTPQKLAKYNENDKQLPTIYLSILPSVVVNQYQKLMVILFLLNSRMNLKIFIPHQNQKKKY